MSSAKIIATNEDAEKLLNYLLSYKNRVDNAHPASMQGSPLEENLSMVVFAPEKALVAGAKGSRE